jgi:15-cis-phytoene synthase
MSTLEQAKLDAAYRYCRKLNARHGKTFFLATGLLPAAQRPHIHALYGFARYADDLVDEPAPGSHPLERLDALQGEVTDALAGGRATHPAVRALVETVRAYDIAPRLIEDFLDAMRADLTVTRYETFADLQGYMWGSAAVIGLQVLPILGVTGDEDAARRAAGDLGVAFQLTNFIRDIGEDYRRGRIYLPTEDLARREVTPDMLARHDVTPELRALLIAEIARTRAFYRRAADGVEELAATARDCVRTAITLYSGILTEIEEADYEVLAGRISVGLGRRALIGGQGYVRAVGVRSLPAIDAARAEVTERLRRLRNVD